MILQDEFTAITEPISYWCVQLGLQNFPFFVGELALQHNRPLLIESKKSGKFFLKAPLES